MRKGLTLLVAVSLVAFGASAVQAEAERSFTDDGFVYSYRIINKGDKQLVVGTVTKFGQKRNFRLVVQDGKVRGDVGADRVAFAVSEAREQNIQLASD